MCDAFLLRCVWLSRQYDSLERQLIGPSITCMHIKHLYSTHINRERERECEKKWEKVRKGDKETANIEENREWCGILFPSLLCFRSLSKWLMLNDRPNISHITYLDLFTHAIDDLRTVCLVCRHFSALAHFFASVGLHSVFIRI